MNLESRNSLPESHNEKKGQREKKSGIKSLVRALAFATMLAGSAGGAEAFNTHGVAKADSSKHEVKKPETEADWVKLANEKPEEALSKFGENIIAAVDAARATNNWEGVLAINEKLAKTANLIALQEKPNKKVKMLEMDMRLLMQEAMKAFPASGMPMLYAGDGGFIFNDIDRLLEVASGQISKATAEEFHNGRHAGLTLFTHQVTNSLNRSFARDGHLSTSDNNLVHLLQEKNIIRGVPGRFEPTGTVDYLILALPEAYVHEKQHREFAHDPAIIKRTVEMWNRGADIGPMKPANFLLLKQLFVKYLRDHGYQIGDFNENEQINTQDILRAVQALTEGKQLAPADGIRLNVMSEFWAYSTDGAGGNINAARVAHVF